MKVQNVCSVGDAKACEKIRFTETGSFSGGVLGGATVGAALSGTAASGLCVALGVPSAGAGTLVCALVVVGVGSFAAGTIVGKAGEKTGELIYEATK